MVSRDGGKCLKREKEMSPWTELREEIRERGGREGEASPPARVRGKTEVTQKTVAPEPEEESEGAQRKRLREKGRGEAATARGEVGLRETNGGSK